MALQLIIILHGAIFDSALAKQYEIQLDLHPSELCAERGELSAMFSKSIKPLSTILQSHQTLALSFQCFRLSFPSIIYQRPPQYRTLLEGHQRSQQSVINSFEHQS